MSIRMAKRTTACPVLLLMLTLFASACSGAPATAVPTQVPVTAVPPEPTAVSAETAVPPTAAPAAQPAVYWPTDGWRTSTPEEQGMDSAPLAEMAAEIGERNMNIHSLLVIRNGYLVSENYFSGGTKDSIHVIFSATKSFISTLIGIALDQGAIATLDQPVLDYFPERPIANLDQRKESITLEDLLMMRSGLDWAQDDVQMFNEMKKQPDWVQYVLDRPMATAPGEKWVYCSGCSHLLSAILQEATGMNTRAFASQVLFEPLGISEMLWLADPHGIPDGGAGMRLKPRDMAKLGYLYLQDGQWDGQQIVSKEWVEKVTQRTAVIDEHFGFGRHWFTVDSLNGYAALGSKGQIILVLPEVDLIVVSTAYTDESIFELVEKYVIPAIQTKE